MSHSPSVLNEKEADVATILLQMGSSAFSPTSRDVSARPSFSVDCPLQLMSEGPSPNTLLHWTPKSDSPSSSSVDNHRGFPSAAEVSLPVNFPKSFEMVDEVRQVSAFTTHSKSGLFTWRSSVSYEFSRLFFYCFLNFHLRPQHFLSPFKRCVKGAVSAATVSFLQSLSRPFTSPKEGHVYLFPNVADAAAANEARLKRIPYPDQAYEACDVSQNVTSKDRDAWLARCQAPAYLGLRIGAPVMLLKSGGSELPTGSIGKVTAAANHITWEKLRRVCAKLRSPPTLVIIGDAIQRKSEGSPSAGR
ncbi:hypothetical protein A4X13_0g3282 [Tilletia indica]|uniref:Uncharacterized protein n=1 Tax=Tilletia indica TaxID=43049 RepID=A0A177TCF6_9BASI|nr:hypothetical protein A4X13_0g3282 [Tilletia indica]